MGMAALGVGVQPQQPMGFAALGMGGPPAGMSMPLGAQQMMQQQAQKPANGLPIASAQSGNGPTTTAASGTLLSDQDEEM